MALIGNSIVPAGVGISSFCPICKVYFKAIAWDIHLFPPCCRASKASSFPGSRTRGFVNWRHSATSNNWRSIGFPRHWIPVVRNPAATFTPSTILTLSNNDSGKPTRLLEEVWTPWAIVRSGETTAFTQLVIE